MELNFSQKLFVFLVCLLSLKSTNASDSDVLVLNDDNFESTIKEHKVLLVEFYAPWCGHCKALAPKYDKAAEILKANDPPAYIAKIDCIEEGKEICGQYGVSGYPTLKVFRDGELSSDYSSGRETSDIVKYMRAQVGPATKELKTVAQVEEFISKEDTAIIGFYESDKSTSKEAYITFADKNREAYRCGHSINKDVLKKYKKYKDSVVLFRPKHLQNKFEDSEVVFKGKVDTEPLKEFVQKNYHGLVGHRRNDNVDEFPKDLVTVYFKVDFEKNAKTTKYWRNRVLKVAKEYKNTFNFAIASTDEFGKELTELGLEDQVGEKPNLAAKIGGYKYVSHEEFSPETLKKFLDGLKSKKIEPYIKSEPIPDDNDKNPVKVAVGKNFKELVTDSKKDVLIEFYAPWCGHCKSLAPVYDKLGKRMEKEPNVLIVKMDATANDVPPPYVAKGFPTIYFTPKGGEPVVYEGGRELKDFTKYLAKHSTKELVGYNRDGKKKKAAKTEL